MLTRFVLVVVMWMVVAVSADLPAWAVALGVVFAWWFVRRDVRRERERRGWFQPEPEPVEEPMTSTTEGTGLVFGWFDPRD